MSWDNIFKQGMGNTKSFLFGDQPTLGSNFIGESNPNNFMGSGGMQLGSEYTPATSFLSPELYGMDQGLNSNVNFGAFNKMGESFNGMGQWASRNAPLLNFGGALINGVGGLISNSKNFGLMKDSINNQQNQWNQQYDMQRQLVNNQLAERQGRKIAANPNAESKDEYMKKWGV